MTSKGEPPQPKPQPDDRSADRAEADRLMKENR
jgi:hypothetical protein